MVTGNKFDGEVFVVTGAGGGLGRGIGRALLDDGARVVMTDLVVPVVQNDDAERVHWVKADVTSPEDARRVVQESLDRFGRLDGLVNNAGVVTLDAAWDARPVDWVREMEVNVVGAFIFAQAVGVHLRDHGGGRIVNVSSNCGKAGYPNMGAYNSSKAAVIGLTRSLSMEWASAGINVNAVCPGGVDTPMLGRVADWLSERIGVPSDELLAGIGPAQLDRKVAPIEVSRVVSFLLSSDADIIRGQAISIDGGDTPY